MPVGSVIELPRDQYAHPGADKEWWWHTGTLMAGDRPFGFEINASGVSNGAESFQYVELMITDIQEQKHYQITNGQAWDPAWAESDPTKPWYVRMDSTDGTWSVLMWSDPATPYKLNVSCNFQDQDTKTNCMIGLSLEQNDIPLFVWGTGVREVDPSKTNPLQRNNYYYSFTKLAARGIVAIGTTTYPVTGMTWMDHEYGGFPTGTKWILQDAQLSNGYHLSNFIANEPVKDGQRMASTATILTPEGDSIFVDTTVTPMQPDWTDPQGTTFCLVMVVEIPTFNANLTIESRMPNQLFLVGEVYEGVALVRGNFDGQDVTGTGWIEQVLTKPPATSPLNKAIAARR